jgi:nucleotide-binding universal stress UspA family protein
MVMKEADGYQCSAGGRVLTFRGRNSLTVKKILHPTDFSHQASRALQFAYALAQTMDAELHLVHIDDLPTIMNSADRCTFPEMDQERKAALTARLKEYCKEYIGDQPGPGISCEVRLHGSVAHGLMEVLRDTGPDLVVMGAHGHSRLRELLVGSTTRYLIAHASCPVLTVPVQATPGGSFRRIVYASGYDADDQAVINTLAHFAAPYDATITVLHIFSQPAGNESERTTFEQRLTRRVSYPRLQFTTRVAHSPNKAITQYAEETGADLLVMYERNHSGILGLFHRDKVQHLALHTPVPLLSYNRRALAANHLKTLTSL